jgi:hypothetical protein
MRLAVEAPTAATFNLAAQPFEPLLHLPLLSVGIPGVLSTSLTIAGE